MARDGGVAQRGTQMNAHYDVDEVVCPECDGTGYDEKQIGWIECPRCRGTRKIIIKIKKLNVEEE